MKLSARSNTVCIFDRAFHYEKKAVETGPVSHQSLVICLLKGSYNTEPPNRGTRKFEAWKGI